MQDGKPVQLHVMHDSGGGMERWLRDYCREDSSRINLILRSKTANKTHYGLELFLQIDDEHPARTWNFFSPLFATTITHAEYRSALYEIIRNYKVDCIYISSLIGHSLDVMDMGLDTIKIMHDYHPFCPKVNIYLNGVCRECNLDRLVTCLGVFGRKARKKTASNALEVRKHFLRLVLKRDIKLVVPTDSVRSNLIRLETAFKDADFVEIAHGVDGIDNDDRAEERQRAPEAADGRRKILVLGVLATKKGLQLFKDSFKEILGYADVYLVGCGDNGKLFDGQPGIHVICKYKQRELSGIIKGISPDLGLLMSIVPETFSYTLCELTNLGIPAMVTDRGAFTDRVVDGVNGFLFSPDKASLLDRLHRVLSQPDELSCVRKNLLKLPRRTVAEMVADYHSIAMVDSGIQPVDACIKDVCMPEMARHYFFTLFKPRTWDYFLVKKWRINVIEIVLRKKLLKPLLKETSRLLQKT